MVGEGGTSSRKFTSRGRPHSSSHWLGWGRRCSLALPRSILADCDCFRPAARRCPDSRNLIAPDSRDFALFLREVRRMLKDCATIKTIGVGDSRPTNLCDPAALLGPRSLRPPAGDGGVGGQSHSYAPLEVALRSLLRAPLILILESRFPVLPACSPRPHPPPFRLHSTTLATLSR